MTDWTDRRRPVMERYGDWEVYCEAHGRLNVVKVHPIATAQLLHDLAAVLREGAECCALPIIHPAKDVLEHWQREACDPETGERVFP